MVREVQHDLDALVTPRKTGTDPVVETYHDAIQGLAVGLVSGADAGFQIGSELAYRGLEKSWKALGGRH